jgi:dihydrofolate reductase / thymidylate synthase
MVRTFSIVTAITSSNQGIGYKGELPWKLPNELKQFQKLTTTATPGILTTTTTSSISSISLQPKQKINAVIMGRSTWDSLPVSVKPLCNRLNIVLTRNTDLKSVESTINQDIVFGERKSLLNVCSSIDHALHLCDSFSTFSTFEVDHIFIIGGASLYKDAIVHPSCQSLIVTEIMDKEDELPIVCDSFFPEIDKTTFKLSSAIVDRNVLFKETDQLIQKKRTYRRYTYNSININRHTHTHTNADTNTNTDKNLKSESESKVITKQDASTQTLPDLNLNLNSLTEKTKTEKEKGKGKETEEEDQYLQTVSRVLTSGIERNDRTGVTTRALFGGQMRFSLSNNQFPLLTTKKVAFKAVAEELFWIIRGCTDSKELSKKNVKIWDANGSRKFLDSIGKKEREEGDLGPVYGFQWRHSGAKYIDCKTDYEGKGIDQLAEIIRLIKTDPDSRRILLSAWNPSDLSEMALPPCHILAQFFVDKSTKRLSCLFFQRSCDLGLGVPFNIASYSLLTILLAHYCDLTPHELIYTMGDYHIYKNHIGPLQEQLTRSPKSFPTLKIVCPNNNNSKPKDITGYTFDNLVLEGYDPHPSIKMEMAL